MLKRSTYLLLLTLVLGSCMKEKSQNSLDLLAEAVVKEQYFIRDYLRGIRQDSGLVVHPSGMCYKILHPGNNRDYITPENVPVVIFERSVFPSDKIIESSLGLPTSFDGRALKNHILGWQVGLPQISKGGRIKMYIPSPMAFGTPGVPGIIPPNAILTCDVTLVDFK